MRYEWEPPEITSEDALSYMESILDEHYRAEPAYKSGRHWKGWEERRRVFERAIEDLRCSQVLQAIRSLAVISNGTIPAGEMADLYDAALRLGWEAGLKYLNEKRRDMGLRPLTWVGGHLGIDHG